MILVGNAASIIAAERLGRGAMHVALRPTRLNGLRVPSKAQTEQIRSIDVARLLRPLGKLGGPDLDAVDAALRYHLAL